MKDVNRANPPIPACRFTYDFDAAIAFKCELEKEIPGISEKLSAVELDKLIDLVHNKTLEEIQMRG